MYTRKSVFCQSFGPLSRDVTLDDVKKVPELSTMVLVNNSRLSVQPVTDAEWGAIVARVP